MTSHSEADSEVVIDLAAARARRRGPAHQARTIILQIANVRADGEAHRQLGVIDSLELADLRDVIAVAFGLRENAPWSFHDAAGKELDRQAHLREHLGRIGEKLTFCWGLWEFRIVTAHSWIRDDGTPWALCVGGSGRFGDTGFDIARINAELTGTETTRDVMRRTRPQVRGIIERSRLFDLVPLLQALDLGRDVHLKDSTREILARLPLETDPEAIDAFWAMVLALSCLGNDELTDTIAESIMEAIGWVDDDGSHLPAAEVRQLCDASLHQLAAVGAMGPRQLAPVDKLDIFRGLLRAAE